MKQGKAVVARWALAQMLYMVPTWCSAAGPRSTRSPRVSKDAAVQEEVPLSTHKEALDINNLLLRGSVLKKTDWAIGLAVNVGDDSKIVQNMTKAPRKVTRGFAGWLETLPQACGKALCSRDSTSCAHYTLHMHRQLQAATV
jgi:magnesium-transporting ATPase (P-type)